jgi:hypothetical protein
MSALASESLPSARYLTVAEVAQIARCEHKAVRRAISTGLLTAFHVAGRLLIRETDALAWIEARPAATATSEPRRSRSTSRQSRSDRHPVPGSAADLRAIERRATSQ